VTFIVNALYRTAFLSWLLTISVYSAAWALHFNVLQIMKLLRYNKVTIFFSKKANLVYCTRHHRIFVLKATYSLSHVTTSIS